MFTLIRKTIRMVLFNLLALVTATSVISLATSSAIGQVINQEKFFERIAPGATSASDTIDDVYGIPYAGNDTNPSKVDELAPALTFDLRKTLSIPNANLICNDIEALNTSTVFIACNRGLIYKWNGTGANPTAVVSLGVEHTFYDIKVVSGSQLYAVGAFVVSPGVFQSELLTSKDAGNSWQSVWPLNEPSLVNKVFSSVDFSSFTSGTIVGSVRAPGLDDSYNTINKGMKSGTWIPSTLSGQVTTNFGNQLANVPGLLATSGNVFCRSTNQGINWTCTAPPGNETQISGIYFVNSTTGYMVGGVGTTVGWYRTSSDGGLNWSSRSFVQAVPFNEIHFADNNLSGWITAGNVTATGTTTGAIYETSNGGASWSSQVLPTKMKACTSPRFANTSPAQYNVLCVGNIIVNNQDQVELYGKTYTSP